MKTKLLRLAVCLSIVPLIASCNIYKPFTGNSSDEDHIEAARKCLHDGDYACALEEYNKLPAGELKSNKLCRANLGRAGFTLTALINTFKEAKLSVLGTIANQLLPYTDEKGAAAAEALTHCAAFQTAAAATEPKLGVLLKTLGAFVQASTLMAKATVFAGTGASDCNARATALASVRKSVIATTNDGTVDPANPGMCSTDATAFATALGQVDPDALQNAQLTDLFNAAKKLKDEKPDLFNNADATSVRTAIQETLVN